VEKKVKKKMMLPFKNGSSVFLDTMVFIYHFEANPGYKELTTEIFSSIEAHHFEAYTSTITVSELLHSPYKKGNLFLAREYKSLLNNFPNLSVLDIDLSCADIAAVISSKYSLDLPDALQLACAIDVKADYFITNDKKLKRVKEIKVVLLNEMRK
jgi:predicted nucleic acid-binding protein